VTNPQDVHICFVGDSFVNGVGDPECLGWVGRLCKKNASTALNISQYNLGVRGNTSVDVAQRWQHECDVRFVQVKNPYVVFSFGVNDTVMVEGASRVPFSRSIEITADLLTRAAARYPSLMIGPPPIADVEQNERIQRLDVAFEKLCRSKAIAYLSLYQHLKNEQAWLDEVATNDGSHPQAAGYTRISDIIYSWQDWWFSPNVKD